MQERDVFLAAIDLEPDERAAYLDDACAGNDELRARLESLIAAAEVESDLLDSPAVEEIEQNAFEGMRDELCETLHDSTAITSSSAGGEMECLPETSHPPDYEIPSELGRGGMGAVYKARQHSDRG